MKVTLVSLGCDKNRVDSENMIGFLTEGGVEVVDSPEMADAVIINSCAFLQAAIKETINLIFSIKNEYPDVKIILTGCLPLRYLDSISGDDGLTEVNAFLGNTHYHKICDVLQRVILGEKVVLPNDNGIIIESKHRALTTPLHYANLKIAEGCNNHCTYCAIPKIRGKYISTDEDIIVAEAERLISVYGTQEFILVAQDVTRYGSDKGEYKLMKLLDKLTKLDLYKIRLMYMYPELVTSELIDRIAKDNKIASYIDMPLQHVSDSILKRMNRRGTYVNICKIMDKIKETNISVRSTFMVGFPEEKDEDIELLVSFLKKYEMENVGFFAFSKEEGTPAYKMKGQIPQYVKKQRLNYAEKIQSEIMTKQLDKNIGLCQQVTYDGIDYDKQIFYGHTEFNHPEIDKKVYFKSNIPVDIGKIYNVKIEKREKLNLIGKII